MSRTAITAEHIKVPWCPRCNGVVRQLVVLPDDDPMDTTRVTRGGRMWVEPCLHGISYYLIRDGAVVEMRSYATY